MLLAVVAENNISHPTKMKNNQETYLLSAPVKRLESKWKIRSSSLLVSRCELIFSRLQIHSH